jgi:radical SAM protein with 4Fe4S-binding SPASM domain
MKLNEIDIHLTNRCNLHCKTCCYTSNDLKLPELSIEKVLAVIDEAISLGCKDIHFSGGEPFLRKDIFQLVEKVLSKNVHLRIQTNGTLLTKNNAKILREIGLKDLMISIDGHTKETCDYLRGAGSFEGAINGIRNALSENFDVRVNAVLTSANKTLFFEIIKLSASLGVSKCSSFYFTPIGRGANNYNLWITPNDYIQTFDELSEKINNFKQFAPQTDLIIEKAYAKWEEATSMSIEGFTGCGGGCSHVFNNRDYLIVRCDGNVYPCILLIDTPFNLGNVENEPLEKIWKYAQNWEILDRRQATDECGECVHLSLCNGGCAGYAHIFLGSYNKHDPRCVKNEIVPLCPIMKYNFRNDRLGGSSDDVLKD